MMVATGVTPAEATRIATSDNAATFHIADRLGAARRDSPTHRRAGDYDLAALRQVRFA
jgi:hypothetical protein